MKRNILMVVMIGTLSFISPALIMAQEFVSDRSSVVMNEQIREINENENRERMVCRIDTNQNYTVLSTFSERDESLKLGEIVDATDINKDGTITQEDCRLFLTMRKENPVRLDLDPVRPDTDPIRPDPVRPEDPIRPDPVRPEDPIRPDTDPSIYSVKPIFECIVTNTDHTYTAHFGYKNFNNNNVTIPVGEKNTLTGGGLVGIDQGQTSLFTYPAEYHADEDVRRTGHYPNNPFFVVFNGTDLVWELTGPNGITRTATASSTSVPCSEDYLENVIIVIDMVSCEQEANLPNWGTNAPDITKNTTSEFILANENCVTSSHKLFQWGDEQSIYPGDTFVGEAFGWNTVARTDINGRTMFKVSLNEFEADQTISFRKVLETSDLVFSYQDSGNTNSNSVSAEFYCHTDGMNYDNLERISNPRIGEYYYCISFNVDPRGTETPDDENEEEVDNTNSSNSNGGGGSSSSGSYPGGFSFGNNNSGGGEVLGASTESFCYQYAEFLQRGDTGYEVLRIQKFLNDYENANIVLDGDFGQLTHDAVSNFQQKYWREILQPWTPELSGNTTGRWYKTTKAWANELSDCRENPRILEDTGRIHSTSDFVS